MRVKKVCLSKGIKVGYREALDFELAEIASTLFAQTGSPNLTTSYKLELIKAKNNCQTYRLVRGDEVYFLKKFFDQPLYKKILNVFRVSKAFRCYATSFKLLSVNIPVAEPVMYLTYSRWIIEKESIFVTKKAAGIELMDFLTSPSISSSRKEEALKVLFHLLGHFCKNRFKHGDPCLYNYLIDPRKDDYFITFVDLDQIHRVPYMPVYLALHCLTKIRRLGGGSLLQERWPIYVQTFLNAFNPKIDLAKAIRDIEKENERRTAAKAKRYKKA